MGRERGREKAKSYLEQKINKVKKRIKKVKIKEIEIEEPSEYKDIVNHENEVLDLIDPIDPSLPGLMGRENKAVSINNQPATILHTGFKVLTPQEINQIMLQNNKPPEVINMNGQKMREIRNAPKCQDMKGTPATYHPQIIKKVEAEIKRSVVFVHPDSQRVRTGQKVIVSNPFPKYLPPPTPISNGLKGVVAVGSSDDKKLEVNKTEQKIEQKLSVSDLIQKFKNIGNDKSKRKDDSDSDKEEKEDDDIVIKLKSNKVSKTLSDDDNDNDSGSDVEQIINKYNKNNKSKK